MTDRILLIEDDTRLAEMVRDYLDGAGFRVTRAPNGATGLTMHAREVFDAVVLDLMLPDMDGLSVCSQIRARAATPILMLTARGQLVDRVVGLRLGADDYLVKPFEMAELLARVEALLRRVPPVAVQAEVYQFGDLHVDFRKAEVRRRGDLLDVSAREFKLLKYFIEHRGATLSRDELLNEVWGYNAMPSTRTVDVHIAWLRQKLETNPRRPEHIHTIHGLGYKFSG